MEQSNTTVTDVEVIEETTTGPIMIPSTVIPATSIISEWDRTGLSFLNVAPGSQQSYTFTYLGKKKIKSTKAGCSCTSTLVSGNQVKGVLTIDKDFSHVKGNTANVVKSVTVTFDDNETTSLSLSATINKLFKSAK